MRKLYNLSYLIYKILYIVKVIAEVVCLYWKNVVTVVLNCTSTL
jgi:hypothetical protein